MAAPARKAAPKKSTPKKTTKKPAAKKKTKIKMVDPSIGSLVGWAYIPEVGRGVIALKAIKKGTVIERSPVVIGPAKDFIAKHGKMTTMDHYLLTWEEKGENVEYAAGLGYLMLYNHSAYPNAEFRFRYKRREIDMVALRDIKKGEEVTHDYGGDGVWFTPRDEEEPKPVKKKPAKKKAVKKKRS